jgi:hypothetical protein
MLHHIYVSLRVNGLDNLEGPDTRNKNGPTRAHLCACLVVTFYVVTFYVHTSVCREGTKGSDCECKYGHSGA